jgi:hypothetical protein
MVKLNINRVLTLPKILLPGAWYLVSGTDYVEMYIVSSQGVLRKLGNTEMINELIENKLGSLLINPESRITNEIPLGNIDGINVTFTTKFNFTPESVTVYLNGILQKVVVDFNTVGNNTIFFTESPGVTEYLSINYIKL